MCETINNKICKIVANVFNISYHQVSPETSPANVKNWDSLQHLNLVLALEQSFGIQLLPEEIQQIQKVETIISLVKGKLEQ